MMQQKGIYLTSAFESPLVYTPKSPFSYERLRPKILCCNYKLPKSESLGSNLSPRYHILGIRHFGPDIHPSWPSIASWSQSVYSCKNNHKCRIVSIITFQLRTSRNIEQSSAFARNESQNHNWNQLNLICLNHTIHSFTKISLYYHTYLSQLVIYGNKPQLWTTLNTNQINLSNQLMSSWDPIFTKERISLYKLRQNLVGSTSNSELTHIRKQQSIQSLHSTK